MIELEQVSFAYGWLQAPALAEVSLRIGAEEVVGVVGENGAGKSTLLRLVAGLMRPSRGTVRVGGRAEAEAIRRLVAYVPDEGGLYPFLSVEETGRFLAGLVPGWDDEAWRRAVERLELPAGKRAGALSRGQRARLRMAAGLAQRAPVLVLDEPLAGIDPASRERIVAMLADDLAERPRALLLATHEVAEVESLLERVILLEAGRVRVDEAADQLREASGMSLDGWLRRGARG